MNSSVLQMTGTILESEKSLSFKITAPILSKSGWALCEIVGDQEVAKEWPRRTFRIISLAVSTVE